MQKKKTKTYSQGKKEVIARAERAGIKIGKIPTKKQVDEAAKEFLVLKRRIEFDDKVRDTMVKISAAMHDRMPAKNRRMLDDICKHIARFGPGFNGRKRITGKDIKDISNMKLADILKVLFK